jgi:tRNA (guanine-N7-)-methyltransferase
MQLPPTEHLLARTAEYQSRRLARLADLRQTAAGLCRGRGAITLEIGSGHGHFLTAYARAHPDRFCLGIDLVRDRVDRARRKQNRAGVDNLRFVIAEAEELLASWPDEARLGECFVLFPDPWPKRRHHKNRLIQAPFLAQLASRCQPSARLCFRTDHEPYFRESQSVAAGHPAWRLVSEPWPFELATVFQERAPTFHSWIARCQPPL